MNWRFWDRSDKAGDDCAAIEPLLSLYSDGMASPAEARRIESHLPDCPECRQALNWMQATRVVIAARPAVPPPVDLRARIARAIAEAEPVKAPIVPAPVRPTRRPLRPAFAYGLSIAAFAALAGSLFWSGHPAARTAENDVHPPAPVNISRLPTPPPTTRPTPTNTRPHADLPRPIYANLPHPSRPHLTPHRSVVDESPSPRLFASNPEESGQDSPDTTVAVVTTRKPVILPVRVAKPLKVKTHVDMTHMAKASVPEEHSTVAPPKPPVAPHEDRVARNFVPDHSDVPDVPTPHIVVDHSVITPDVKLERHEASVADILRGTVQHMQQASLTSHSYALKGAAEAGQEMASDSSRILPITNGGFH